MRHVGRPSPNAAMLAALARACNVPQLDSVVAAIRKKFPGKVGEANVTAAEAAFHSANVFK